LGPLVGFWLLQKQKQVQKPNQRDPELITVFHTKIPYMLGIVIPLKAY